MTDQQEQKYRIWWDEKNGMLRAEVLAYLDEDNLKDIHGLVTSEAERHGGKLPVLVNLSHADSASFGARQILVEMFKSSLYTKCAIVESKTYDRVFMVFIIRAASAKGVDFFANEEDAISWLKEK